ncbi:phage tail protein [Aeromonas veronii]|uniref:phage tail protein n=1 Tax=Aeromonas veronii TaxID=654 RepID=UPI0018F1D294|nr:phage tail protein [Aeromonas veronii]MBJ7581639.1 phage tail protein [Aeromonas veronii]
MSNFGAILTNAGAAKLANAIALGVPLKLTQMAVGDGNGQPVAPDPAMTAIPGEKRRAAINTLFADPLAASQLVAEQIIPEDVGGWWIRCVGLYDDSNTLIAIANVPDTYKPLLTSGAGRTQIIRMVLIVSDTSAVELKIDPAVVLATRKYVDDVMKAHKESRDHPDGTKIEKGMLRLATDDEAKAGENDTSAITSKGVALAIGERHLKSGQPLPTKNIGPIWHDDYASWMVWQEFTANGANYRGYASQLIGRLLLDTQPTPRAGYIKSGVQNLSRVTYAALRAWAMHNGLMVAPGVWAAGAIQCADNADGTTFRIYDVRSEFFRALDDGRGVDTGRVFGSPQASANLSHFHVAEYAFLRKGANPGGVNSPASAYSKTYFDPSSEDGQLRKVENGSWGGGSVGLTDLPSGGPEARPRNSALLAAIKY